MDDLVILVDRNNRELGYEDKMVAHRDGKLHRAFSVFILDRQDRLLLQRRASIKYHSGGLWTNTCCSHPRPHEAVTDAAHRRLMEEMGFDCPLQAIFSFVYRAELDNGLIEYEFDHVLTGRYEGEPIPNGEEVDGWKWADLDWLHQDIGRNPHSYTYWLKACFKQVGGLLRGGRMIDDRRASRLRAPSSAL